VLGMRKVSKLTTYSCAQTSNRKGCKSRDSQATHITVSATSYRHPDFVTCSKPVVHHLGCRIDHHSTARRD
jgi:hypothetical protein